jgi:hypothetical protein
MMLELILRKCRDDNFVSLIHGPDRNDARRTQDKAIGRLSILLIY